MVSLRTKRVYRSGFPSDLQGPKKKPFGILSFFHVPLYFVNPEFRKHVGKIFGPTQHRNRNSSVRADEPMARRRKWKRTVYLEIPRMYTYCRAYKHIPSSKVVQRLIAQLQLPREMRRVIEYSPKSLVAFFFFFWCFTIEIMCLRLFRPF